MKIVFLDVKTIGEDIDLSAYDELGEVVKYSFSSSEGCSRSDSYESCPTRLFRITILPC